MAKKTFNFSKSDDDPAESGEYGEPAKKKKSGSSGGESDEHKQAMSRCLAKNKSRETCEKLCAGY